MKFNVISHQPDIDKIYLYAEGQCKAKYRFLIGKRESTGLKYYKDFEAFAECSNDVDNIYKNIGEYNPN